MKVRTFLVAALVMATATVAHAQVTGVTTRPSVNPDGSVNNDAVDYGQFNVPSGQGNGTQLPVPQPFASFSGIEGQIGDPGDQFLINRQCCQSNLGGGFTANFGIGDWLVYPNPNATQRQQPPHTAISFKKGVSFVGTQLTQYSLAGPLIAKVQVFDHSGRLLGTFTESGNNSQTSDNTAIFLGVTSATQNMMRVVYTVTDPAGNPTIPVINFLSVRQ
jgi:hypothetical protein